MQNLVSSNHTRFSRLIFGVLVTFALGSGLATAHPSLSYTRIEIDETNVYETAPEFGLRYSGDGGATWGNRNTGLPKRIVYPFEATEYRELLDISVDPTDPLKIAVVTGSDLLVSDDGGKAWRRLATGRPISRVEVFTSVERAVDGTIYLGSSFNGLYVSRDEGNSWESLEEQLTGLYLGAGFNEEIRALAVSSTDPEVVYVVAGFGRGAYLSDDGGKSFSNIEIPSLPEDGPIVDIYFRIHESGEELVVVRQTSYEVFPDGTPAGEANRFQRRIAEGVFDAPSSSASGRTGIYVNSAHAHGDRLAAHLDLVEEHGMDSIVVDMKDDSGFVSYDTTLAIVDEVGALRERFELDDLVRATHERGVYLIGRVVVFQDPKLFRYDDGEYAAWNDETEKPWGNFIPVRDDEGNIVRREQREFWVDPYCEAVWDYNIAIAAELESRGVDEVQFDYIRFPSDGDVKAISYRFAREGMSKSEAIESFLKKARSNLTIPIGIDVFGFNGWYFMGNWIGQNIAAMAKWVDVISPMYYPSHYPRSFLGEMGYFDRAREIYEAGSNRAVEIVEGSAIIRPYVQTFLIGGERRYEEAEYGEYLTKQLDGVLRSGASGFTLWNASNNYYMIVDQLDGYTEGYTADREAKLGGVDE